MLDQAIVFFEKEVLSNRNTSKGPHYYQALLALKEKKQRRDNPPVQVMPDTAPFSNGTTSKEAAKKVELSLTDLRLRVLECISSSGMGRTGSEIADLLNINLYTAKPRCTELRDAGYIVDSGSVRKNVHGNNEIVWVKNPAVQA